LSIGLAIVGVGVFDGGVTGLCLGLIAGRMVLGIVAPVAVGRVLELPLRSQVRAAIQPFTVSVVVFAGALAVSEHFTIDSWFRLIPVVLVTVVAVGLAAAFTGLHKEQRAQLIMRARATVSRLRSST